MEAFINANKLGPKAKNKSKMNTTAVLTDMIDGGDLSLTLVMVVDISLWLVRFEKRGIKPRLDILF